MVHLILDGVCFRMSNICPAQQRLPNSGGLIQPERDPNNDRRRVSEVICDKSEREGSKYGSETWSDICGLALTKREGRAEDAQILIGSDQNGQETSTLSQLETKLERRG